MQSTSRTKGNLALSIPVSLVGLEPELGTSWASACLEGKGHNACNALSFCWFVLDVHLHSILDILSVFLGSVLPTLGFIGVW